VARVRVYVSTYRRPHLLRRALDSLRAQTVTDWVCELHNDDPDDDRPEAMLAEVQDARIRYVRHAVNLGATRSFNLFHQTVDEPFFTLLEDDNWWEPQFLDQMIGALEAHPHVELAWANMRIWQEQPDATWMDTGVTTWPPGSGSIVFTWPHLLHVNDALHSNGAMLVRSAGAERHRIPDSTPMAAMELVRERTYTAPLLLVSQVLANFAATRQSWRGDQRVGWEQTQFLLTRSFLDHVPMTPAAARRIWSLRRDGTRATTPLLLAALSRGDLSLLRHSVPGDWIALLRTLAARPFVVWGTLRARHAHPDLATFLDDKTGMLWEAARQRGAAMLDVGGVERRSALPHD
jgi:hypothetical protein